MRKTDHQIYSKFITGVVQYESVNTCLDNDLAALITRLQVANCDQCFDRGYHPCVVSYNNKFISFFKQILPSAQNYLQALLSNASYLYL